MPDWLQWLLDASPFRVPTACGGWTALLANTTIASNFSIFAVYTAIPVLLLALALRREELAFLIRRRIIYLFATFIFCCGVTHLLRGISFWWPAYRLQVAVNAITALVSWVTVLVMIPVITHQSRDPFLRGLPLLRHELDELKKLTQETKEEWESTHE